MTMAVCPGATMERPGLQRLLVDIGQSLIDVVVVYKVDRLTRSLADFAKMVELFDVRGVSFVAVTQQFNTTTSMGRLTLNVLLSFAQFEREVTGERIRDKIAATKRKGLWMGGIAPLGYDVHERHLVINPAEAETLKEIFRRYQELGSVRLLKEDLDRRGIHSKLRIAKNGNRSGGKPFSRGALYKLLSNPICIGEISHKGARHPGQHEAIIERELFEHTQTLLRERAVRRKIRTNKVASSPLAGKLFDESDESLTPSHAVKGERRYRYYVSRNLITGTADHAQRGWRVPAPELERTLAAAVCQILSDQASLAAAAQAIGLAENRLPAIFKVANAFGHRLQSEVDAAAALAGLIERVELKEPGMDVSLKLPIPAAEARENRATPSEVPITRFIPVQVRRRGLEMRLIIEADGAPPPRGTDPALLKVVARAHRWFDRLSSGRARSVEEIALREGITARYVRRLLGLAFLAPELVEAIAGGHQPPDLTAEALSQRINLPLDWTAQKEALDLF